MIPMARIAMRETMNAQTPVTVASSPEIAVGVISGPMPIDRVASMTLLPIISPIAREYSFLLTEVISTSSGNDVPMARAKKAIAAGYGEKEETITMNRRWEVGV